MVALSENSFIPDPDKIANDKAWWLWFMVWNDSGDAGVTSSANFWSGDYYNTSAHKTKVYNHANMITLDELPAL
jgi:mannan endo-1,4-beta-mannosidase